VRQPYGRSPTGRGRTWPERRPRGWSLRPYERCSGCLPAGALDGHPQDLADILAPDVVALGDGGGLKQALPRPAGSDKVARLLSAGLATVRVRMTTELVQVNGWPALLLRLDGEVDGVVSVRVEDGLVSGIYTVRNPEKLSQVLRETAAGR